MSKRSLNQEISMSFQHEQNLILSESIIGIRDADKLAEFINDFCIQNLGSEIEDCLYAGFSVGASFGLQLKNGQKIFLKVNKPSSRDSISPFSLEGIKAISSMQEYLSEHAFPCPKVVIDPIEKGDKFNRQKAGIRAL